MGTEALAPLTGVAIGGLFAYRGGATGGALGIALAVAIVVARIPTIMRPDPLSRRTLLTALLALLVGAPAIWLGWSAWSARPEFVASLHSGSSIAMGDWSLARSPHALSIWRTRAEDAVRAPWEYTMRRIEVTHLCADVGTSAESIVVVCRAGNLLVIAEAARDSGGEECAEPRCVVDMASSTAIPGHVRDRKLLGLASEPPPAPLVLVTMLAATIVLARIGVMNWRSAHSSSRGTALPSHSDLSLLSILATTAFSFSLAGCVPAIAAMLGQL